jgi:hypothetical protein
MSDSGWNFKLETELGIIKEAVQEEIKKLKGNKKLSDIEVLTLQEEEMKRHCKEFCLSWRLQHAL